MRGASATCVCFEPDPRNVERAEAKIRGGDAPCCELVPFGLWSRREEVPFDATSNGSSHVSSVGAVSIPVIDLDSWLGDRPMTFLRLDIEGAEREALASARHTAARDRPTFALSVYHRPDDMLVIPEFVAQVAPEHVWYLRHHSIYPVETVFYGVPTA